MSPGDRRRKTPISTSRGAQPAPKGSNTGQGRGRGALFNATPPLRDLRGLDSRSNGRNVPESQGAGSGGGCPSLPPPPRECSRPTILPLEPVLSSSPPSLPPKNETSFQRPLSLQRPAPVTPEVSLQSGPPSLLYPPL